MIKKYNTHRERKNDAHRIGTLYSEVYKCTTEQPQHMLNEIDYVKSLGIEQVEWFVDWMGLGELTKQDFLLWVDEFFATEFEQIAYSTDELIYYFEGLDLTAVEEIAVASIYHESEHAKTMFSILLASGSVQIAARDSEIENLLSYSLSIGEGDSVLTYRIKSDTATIRKALDGAHKIGL